MGTWLLEGLPAAGQRAAEQWTREAGVTKGTRGHGSGDQAQSRPDDAQGAAHPQNSKSEQQGLKLSPLFIRVCSMKQLRTHTHTAGEGAGSRSLGNWAGPQTLRHWRGTPAGPPTQPPPRVCGRCRGLMSESGPRGNVTGEAPWPGPQPPEPRARRGSRSSRPGKVQAWRGAGRRHGPTRAPQVDLS